MSRYIRTMKNKNFTLEYLPNSIILKLHLDELDLMTSPKIAPGIESVIKNISDTHLIIDIDRLDYIDSTGISLIFSIIKTCSKKEVIISIICKNEKIRQFFSLFSMNFNFTFYPDIEEVFKKFPDK